jgi:hypothetical protein
VDEVALDRTEEVVLGPPEDPLDGRAGEDPLVLLVEHDDELGAVLDQGTEPPVALAPVQILGEGRALDGERHLHGHRGEGRDDTALDRDRR